MDLREGIQPCIFDSVKLLPDTNIFKYISIAAKWIRTSRTYVLNIYTENPAYKIAFQQDFG
ncbi:hypothetical protein HMPREF9008_02420 [Parabacteroides sp. 20_3]|uniref:Uncharacterized protein n=1 Tax=Bacteroides uniformis (strain ATCC 8492 / DSM 6597 / CCUG 4942 / CIP 103695 / JCM 5828 / KCTC 5204 / NCTC 13054 / VPI 0061) TaxID=411479 RepID=A0ABC9NB33_BACUC|nr:hypothetical protein BACUNI_02495 [Bacteroides uniformis ATCC 8492]EFK63335.1 hypothetical protein HMPREF9008_02420 [Parabacteroides sp. 20_3]